MVLMISPTALEFQRMVFPTVLGVPQGTQDNPTVLMLSPTVLNTLSPPPPPLPRYRTHIIQGGTVSLSSKG